MTRRIYANAETRAEIHRLMREARRVAKALNLRITIDPTKARLIDFSRTVKGNAA
jgi:hypothetical protein